MNPPHINFSLELDKVTRWSPQGGYLTLHIGVASENIL